MMREIDDNGTVVGNCSGNDEIRDGCRYPVSRSMYINSNNNNNNSTLVYRSMVWRISANSKGFVYRRIKIRVRVSPR